MSGFGRRPELNGSGGLDHGTVSAALLAGVVAHGRIGKPLDLDQLTETWFGVPGAGPVLCCWVG